MSGKSGFWREGGALRGALEQYPAAFAVGVLYSVAIWWTDTAFELFGTPYGAMGLEALLAAVLSALAGFVAEGRGWDRGRRWGFQIMVFGVFAMRVTMAWGDRGNPVDEYGVVSRLALCGAALALSAWALGARERRVEEGAQRMAVGAAVGGAAAGGLAVGVVAVLEGISALFHTEWNDAIVRFSSGPAMAAGVLVALAWAASERPFALPVAWRVLLKWVALPVHAVFTAVLLAYFAWCTARWDLPDGEIAGFATAAGLGWMLLNLLGSGEKGALAGYARWDGLAVLPLAALQVVALSIRVEQYGLTPMRYGGYAVAALVAVFAVGAAVRPAGWARWGLGWIALVLLVAGASPWSAVDAGVGAQFRRLEDFRARRDAGERFDAGTRAAIMGTADFTNAYERRSGHYRGNREGRGMLSPADFRAEWGFDWVQPWQRESMDEAGVWYSYSNIWESQVCPPASTIRKCRVEDQDGHIVFLTGESGPDVDITDAVMEAWEEAWKDRKHSKFLPILDAGGGRWVLVEEVNGRYRDGPEGRQILSASGRGWLFTE